MTAPTYDQQASSFDLWQEYVDPEGTTTREQFDAMSHADRVDLIIETFGPEIAAITPDQLLDSTAVGCGFHDWNCEGGTIRVTTDELRPVLEEAYDPNMPAWPSLISWDEEYGWHVA
jgi:hypothetical protein